MIKMYQAEVLGKLPVMQHFLFGSIISLPNDFPAAPTSPMDKDDPHAGHNHGTGINTWADCCGIPVPSVFGAKAAVGNAELSGSGIRPIPFD